MDRKGKLMIGTYCKEYRMSKAATLKEMSLDCDVNQKTLSAFENGRSSNMHLLSHYVVLAESCGERKMFIENLGEHL